MNKRTIGFAVFFVFSALLLLVIPVLSVGNQDFKLSNKQHIQQIENKEIITRVDSTQLAEKISENFEPENESVAQKIIKTAKASSDYPYTLEIPSLGINAGVKAMGLESDGRMAVPDNYSEVGWYSIGTRPGETGSAVMGAHVDNGSSVNGVFKQLHTLNVGDDVYVSDGNNEKIHFKVTHTKVYDRNETETTDVWRSSSGSHLNLITCFGTWLPSENTYEKRIVIFTERVN